MLRAASAKATISPIALKMAVSLTRAAVEPADDPFHAFTEWNSEVDRPVRQGCPALVVAEKTCNRITASSGC